MEICEDACKVLRPAQRLASDVDLILNPSATIQFCDPVASAVGHRVCPFDGYDLSLCQSSWK